MKKYRLIVSDIDMTLINSEFYIPQYNADMIHRAVGTGADFMLCTGRIFGSARPYARRLGIETPIITCNGAVTMNFADGSVLSGKPIDGALYENIFGMLDDMGLYYHFYSKDVFYVKNSLYRTDRVLDMNKNLPEEERFRTLGTDDPVASARKDPVYKISVRCMTDDETARFMEAFGEMEEIDITSSFLTNLEISAAGVNKGAALKEYAEMRGIAPEQILAFGDNLNDVEMIKFAGTGVAVSNSVPQLKAAADYVTASNDDCGVGKAIAHLMFGE